MVNCLKLNTSINGVKSNGPLQLAQNAEVLAPWVKSTWTAEAGGAINVSTGGKGALLEQGLVSISPCTIKSFEYGCTDGQKATVEIVDEEGGIFSTFFDNMVKCIKIADSPTVKVDFSWGWYLRHCNGPIEVFPEEPVTVRMIPLKFSTNFNGGIIKYRIEFTDVANVFYNMRVDAVFPNMSLNEAIKALCAMPPKHNVEFKRKEKGKVVDVEPEKFKWQGFPVNKPVRTWRGDSKNPLATIHNWVESFVTEKGKGICIMSDNTKENTISIVEGLVPSKDEIVNHQSLGTFIVNGGDCSNVIEFQPNINFTVGFAFVDATGGSAGGSTGGTPGLKEDVRVNNDTPTAGSQQIPVADSDDLECFPFKDVVPKKNKGQQKQANANAIFMTLNPIEADLIIQGNPSKEYISLYDIIARPLTIIVVNPFHISKTGDGCGDWLAKPRNNAILTSNQWLVRSVNHSIKEGSYRTTLKVFLIGSEGQGKVYGKKIKNSCPEGGQ